MARTCEFKWNKSAAPQIMNSGETQAVILQRANGVKRIADSIGSATYAANVQAGKTRAHAIVYTPSNHAIYSNAKHKSLIKALKSSGL